jgi:hypothetical protein
MVGRDRRVATRRKALPTTNVAITITGSSGSYSATNNPPEPAGGYTAPLSVTFVNSTSGSVTVYYNLVGSAFTLNVTLAAGAVSLAIPSTGAINFNVVPATSNPSTWSHVIHVGSSVP